MSKSTSAEKISCYLHRQASLRDQKSSPEEYSPPFYRPKFGTRREIISPPFYKSKLSAKSIPQVSYDLDTESIISGVEEIKFINSKSSSPSWSDDNDIEGCRRVQDELERMDRVLRGIDPIPLHYDIDEYKQWMETFPTISLFGHNEYGPYKIWKDDVDTDSNKNKVLSSRLSKYKKEIKKAVIHNIYEDISIRLNDGSSSPLLTEVKKKYQQANANKTQVYLTDCLRNSPFSDMIKEKYATNCLLRRTNSQEDDKKVNSPRFQSLPIMLEGATRSSAKPVNKFRNEHTNSLVKKKSKRGILLPPIQDKRLQSSNQFRSISAAPNYSSLLSAKRIDMDSNLFSRKSRNML